MTPDPRPAPPRPRLLVTTADPAGTARPAVLATAVRVVAAPGVPCPLAVIFLADCPAEPVLVVRAADLVAVTPAGEAAAREAGFRAVARAAARGESVVCVAHPAD